MALFRQLTVQAALLGLFAAGILATSSSTQTAAAQVASPKAGGVAPACMPSQLGSPYVPVDSWVYPAIMRLYGLGFVDNVFLGMRPWTRLSIEHMLEQTGEKIEDADGSPAADEAEGIYNSLLHELHGDTEGPCLSHQGLTRVESTYTEARYISGTPLRDSYHLGQTIVNDYGRPYAGGFNSYTGGSGYATAGRFVLYARGELQAGPSFTGYDKTMAETLSQGPDSLSFTNLDGQIYSQATLPYGPYPAYANGRLIEAYLAANVIGHQISFGKQDNWMGPGVGGGMAYSNNAENIYGLEINRVEPLHIPGLSRLLGPFRYEFLIGSVKGHSSPNNGYWSPNDPWEHVEKVSFKPTENVEFGFERTVVWGGKGHAPITIDTFLRSFFSVTAGASDSIKYSKKDPGARFGAFDATWRLPYLHHWMTFYVDSFAHDDVSPTDAPRRAAFRPGLYLSHIPGVQKLDLRVEGIDTDPSTSRSQNGQFIYYEAVLRQGYTNKGFIFGDWMGREGKGGQAWMTWHLSGNEWIQASWRRQKNAKDFIAGGTTLDDESVQVVKRLTPSLELNAGFTYENWLAPFINKGVTLYLPGKQNVTTTSFQLTWYPQRKTTF